MKEITMKTAQKTVGKFVKHSAKKPVSKRVAGSALRGHIRILTGQALLDDMEAYRKKVTATPDSARAFLVRLGVVTPKGRIKHLIRG
jgi:hypothetical protein